MEHDKESGSDNTSLLGHSTDDERSLTDYETQSFRRKPWLNRHRNAVIFNSLMIAFYASLAVVFWIKSSAGCSQRHQLYSPANEYTSSKVQVILDGPHDISASPFVGVEPTPEIDAAWAHLLRFHNLRITEEEMRDMNKSSIAFARGGGYHGMMGVLHEIHCLKLVREAVHSDHYYKGVGPARLAYLAGHTEHCIDILRTAAMCRADTSIFPYHWSDQNRVPNPTWEQKHECVDWERLEEFLDERKVDLHEPNILLHPKYGPSYPGGKSISEPDGPKVYPEDPE